MRAQQRFDTTPEWFQWALTKPGESRFFEYRGTRLHYLAWDETGTDEPVIILIHGHRGHARWWAFIAPFLAENYHIYALDLSGMGDSGHRERYHGSTHPPEILALARHLGNKPVCAIGHSFGGGRLLRASVLDPAAFNQLIIVDAKTYYHDDPPAESPPTSNKSRLYRSLEAGKARFRLSPPQDKSEPYLFDYIAEHSLKQTSDGWTWKFDPRLFVEDHVTPLGEDLLPKVTVQTDIVYGALSEVVSPKDAQRMHALLANPGRLISVPGGYHHLMLSNPTELIDILKELVL